MDELRLMDTSNRRVEVSQEAVVYRWPVAPVAGLVAGYLTRVVRAEALAKLVPTGAISLSGAPKLVRLPMDQEVATYVLMQSGGGAGGRSDQRAGAADGECGERRWVGRRGVTTDNAGRWICVQ